MLLFNVLQPGGISDRDCFIFLVFVGTIAWGSPLNESWHLVNFYTCGCCGNIAESCRYVWFICSANLLWSTLSCKWRWSYISLFKNLVLFRIFLFEHCVFNGEDIFFLLHFSLVFLTFSLLALSLHSNITSSNDSGVLVLLMPLFKPSNSLTYASTYSFNPLLSPEKYT